MSRRKKTVSLWGLLGNIPTEIPDKYRITVNYFQWLKLLALSVFEWENMPETINLRYLEETLFTHGKALFFEDPEKGHLCLKCTAGEDLNIYNDPIFYRVYSHSYDRKVLASESVVIRNNDLETTTQHQMMGFAIRLAETEKTIDINVKAQKTPILILINDKQRITLENLYNQYDDGAPVIIGDKNQLSYDMIKALKTDAPFVVDKLDVHKMNLWNEALTFLGIQNANTDKRERLIVDEVNANNQHVASSANIMLKTRQEACEQINKMFDLDVSVKVRDSVKDVFGWDDFFDEKEGEPNE